MNKIIGFCGFGRAGKDTAASGVASTHRRFAYADKLKQDFQALVEQHYGWDVYNLTEEQKPIIRPYLVAHGAGMRAKNPYHWINALNETLRYALHREAAFCVSDVRYYNEVRNILEDKDGKVIYISRPGFGAINAEEERSFGEIFRSSYWLDGTILRVENDSTPEALIQKIQQLL